MYRYECLHCDFRTDYFRTMDKHISKNVGHKCIDYEDGSTFFVSD